MSIIIQKNRHGYQEKSFRNNQKQNAVICVSQRFCIRERIDKVSRLLLENFIRRGKAVLILAAVTRDRLILQALHPQIVLTMTDINERAVAYRLKTPNVTNFTRKY